MKRQLEQSFILKTKLDNCKILSPLLKRELPRSEFVANWILGLPMHTLKKCAKKEQQQNVASNVNRLDLLKSVICKPENEDEHKDLDLVAPKLELSNDTDLANMLDCTSFSFEMDDEACDGIVENDWELPLHHKVWTMVEYPPDTVKLGATFEVIPVEQYVKGDPLISILVTEVVAPFRFWFLLRKMRKNFETNMAQMLAEYNSLEDDELIMSHSHVFPNQICALRAAGCWARGVIQSYLMGRTVKVLLVDYGLVLDMEPRELRYLKTQYMSMPQQAIRGTLDAIVPHRNREMCKTAKKLFEEIVSGKIFNCNIVKYKKIGDHKACHLKLFARNCGVDICKLFVDKGYGKFKRVAKSHYR